MEAFALLKYWRSAAAPSTIITTADTQTLAAAAVVSPYSSDDEEGPYFDLEFAEPPPKSPENPQDTESEDEETESVEEEEEELKFALASGECTDHAAAALSPSDEVFFRSDLVSIENSKLPVFLAKSATKFRVLMLKLKKSKSGNGGSLRKPEKNEEGKTENKPSGKFMAVKFKVDEGPLLSLFTRDNSSKDNGHGGKGQKGNSNEEDDNTNSVVSESTEERKVQKYLKMVKPLYVRVSKLRLSAAPPRAAEGAARCNSKARNLQSGLKVVRKHLGKSRSASAVTAASNRRETSLPDGIEGAILHCKRSFDPFKDAESSSSILCRSASDPSNEKSVTKTPSFCGEAKETIA